MCVKHQPSSNIGLIANGTIQGNRHGLLYNRTTRLYEADTAGLGPFTRADLVARVLAGDTLTIMGVPPASRQRLGRDRNANGVLDGDEALTALKVERSGAGILISWPTNTVGVVLEFGESLAPPNWRTETSVRSVIADRLSITVPTARHSRFYRLRSL